MRSTDDAPPRTARLASARASASKLARALSTPRLASLLGGSTPFWEGVADMGTGGYNAHAWPAVSLEPWRGACDSPRAMLRFTDGPRGVMLPGGTTFPVSMARGATFDAELETEVGRVIARESAALGANFFAGVCVNLLRHPAWGRAQETYGEDTFHVGEMGVALTRGVQESNRVMACVKHYALNSMENARFQVDVQADERALHEVYLQHFERIVKEGRVASVMSAYNSVNGAFCGVNSYLLNDVLRDKWRAHDVFVVSDFVFGVRGPAAVAVAAGLDVEMPFTASFARDLPGDVKAGRVARAVLEKAATRVLAQCLALDDDEPAPPLTPKIVKEHDELAYRVACASVVLLKNEAGVLPVPVGTGKRVHVVGRLAARPNLGDRGSSSTRPAPESLVTPLAGLRRVYGDANVTHSKALDAQEDGALARKADLVVVVVGRTWRDEGEFVKPTITPGIVYETIPRIRSFRDVLGLGKLLWGQIKLLLSGLFQGEDDDDGWFGDGGDVRDLHLSANQEALIKQAAEMNPRTAVVVQAGTAVMMERWIDAVPAAMMGWYGGQRAGDALADVISGVVSPSGRLPFSVPRAAEDLAPFDYSPNVTRVTYELDVGYRRASAPPPLFPFGFGLSYSTFTLSNAKVVGVDFQTGRVDATVNVTNTGARDAHHSVQVYVYTTNSKRRTAPLELKAFRRVWVAAGQTLEVAFSLPRRTFETYDPAAAAANDPGQGWVVEKTPGCVHGLAFASHSRDAHACRVDVPEVSSFF